MMKKDIKFKEVKSIKEAQASLPYGSCVGKFFKLIQPCIVYKGAVFGHYHLYYGYKKATVKLLLPISSVIYVTRGKCRASEAIVLEIKKSGRKEVLKSCQSDYDSTFKYFVSSTVKPVKAFSYVHDQCASGIHFFSTLTAARDYIHGH